MSIDNNTAVASIVNSTKLTGREQIIQLNDLGLTYREIGEVLLLRNHQGAHVMHVLQQHQQSK
jgi:hypothetical protein